MEKGRGGDDGEWQQQRGRGAKAKERAAIKPSMIEDLSKVKAAYRLKALEAAEKYRESQRSSMQNDDNYEQTQCVMLYLAGGNELSFIADFSGSDKDIRTQVLSNRRSAGVSAQKETVCAEERLLARYSHTFLFSFAFDRMGRKPACSNCKKILAVRGIEDLDPRSGS